MRSIILICLLILLPLVAVADPAAADDFGTDPVYIDPVRPADPDPVIQPVPKVGGAYILGEGGASWLMDSDAEINAFGLKAEGESKYDTGWNAGAALGYRFDRHWRLEGALNYRSANVKSTSPHLNIDLGCVDTRAETDDCRPSPFQGLLAGSDRGNAGTLAMLANAYYDVSQLPDAIGGIPITPYIGLGLGGAWSFADITSHQNLISTNDSAFTFAWSASAGLGYEVMEGLHTTLGYRYLQTLDPEFSGHAAFVVPVQIEMQTQFHELVAGLRYEF
jgi:opacity protein-like surface antigen